MDAVTRLADQVQNNGCRQRSIRASGKQTSLNPGHV